MKTFTVSHEIQCDAERFWKLCFDHDFNVAMYAEVGVYEVLQLEENDGEIVRRVKVTPKPALLKQSVIAKTLGASFSFTEDVRFDKALEILSWSTTPSALADKVTIKGTTKAEPAGPGKVLRVADCHCDAKFFGIGGVLESRLEKNFRSVADNSAGFVNKWIREHP
jgi:hypothetical protein